MIGNCLREAAGIRNFLLTCLPRRLSVHQIRTIAELTCYRDSALEQIETQHLDAIYESIATEFNANSRHGNLGLHFRYLTLCVAFLLRRRIFDDAFIPPDSKVARSIKDTCLRVISDYRNRKIHIMGGSVDLPSVMLQLIKYVDREGQGAFVLAT